MSALPPASPPPSSYAMTALVLGIVGVVGVLGSCCCCLFVLPGLCAPAAWFIGWKERRDIQAGLSPRSGENHATIGMYLGIAGTGLLALYLVLLIVYVLLVGFAGALEALKAGGVPRVPR